MTFTVTDIQGTTATASQTFEHNRLAIIVIESPKPDAVALPQLRLRASCVDDVPLGCNGFEVILAESERIAGDQGIDQDVSLATFDGRLEDLSIDGRLVFISPANGLAPRRYLWTPGGSATEVGSGLGRPKFIE